MKIAICGSMLHESAMAAAEATLQAQGYEVERPNIKEGEFVDGVRAALADTDKRRYIDEHFAKIDTSDAILVVNEAKNGVDGYIGGNTLLEIGRAYAQGLEIFLLNPTSELSYADEIRGMQPIVLNGDISGVDDHFNGLPLVMMSTESPVKHSAVSRGLRRAGIRVRIDGKKIESGVAEQPASVNETYDGAVNRHEGLVSMKVDGADYLATIESGQHKIHDGHNVYGCSVLILEKVGGARKVGIDFDIELPKAMTDRIPSEFPDAGVLVQQVYGSKLKDPFPYFTNGKLTRARILENAVYNLAIQLQD